MSDEQAVLCTGPLAPDGSCPNRWIYGEKNGESCVGRYLGDRGREGWSSRGAFACEVCYRSLNVPVAGVPNAPCEGYEPGGMRVKGLFACE